MDSLDIKVFSGESRKQRELPPLNDLLPKVPFVWCIVGMRGAGKSQLVANILGNYYRGVFHKVYFYSPTRFQTTFKKFEFNEERVFDDYSDEQFEKDVFSHIQEDADEGKRSLIIFDDMIGKEGISNSSNRSKVINFILNSRHYLTSIVIASQSYKAINRAIRINANVLSFFRINNKGERVKIVEELDDEVDTIFIDMKNWGDYDFLTVDLQVPPNHEKRYRHNFLPIN